MISHTSSDGSIIVPNYLSGNYYATHAEPDQDAPFKANAFLRLFLPLAAERNVRIKSYADVGCGGGAVASLIGEGLRDSGFSLDHVAGYDISPHVLSLHRQNVTYYYEDFCKASAQYDLVTLFDVIEHVPSPVHFLQAVAERCSFIGLHIPLDHSLVNAFFDRFRARLRYPGHLVVLDVASALNLLTSSGLLPLDYSYTHGYAAPSGSMTWTQRLFWPARALVANVSPWLASRTLGGVSLMVIAATPKGLNQICF